MKKLQMAAWAVGFALILTVDAYIILLITLAMLGKGL